MRPSSEGLYIIGGTVDPGEDLIEALLREIKEESGLTFRKDTPEINHRHYYAINSIDLPDSWAHTVHSNGADNGLIFDFFWMPCSDAKLVLTGNFGELLP